MEEQKRGRLTLVATPIGNLGDISPRAEEALRSADLVAAEDTRHSGLLLAKLGIKKPMISYYREIEGKREEVLLEKLAAGEDIALISDAGTPGVCDPGAAILRAAVREDFEVDAIPGCCAAITALVLSGLPTERFAFEGFIARGSGRSAYLDKLKTEERTLVFYEAPHRLRESLRDLSEVFGAERQIAVCRELTKKFQEVQRGTLGELTEHWQQREPKGEYVLVVAGAAPVAERTVSTDEVAAHLARLMSGGMKHKAAAKEVAALYGLSVGEVYDMGLQIKNLAK